MKTNLIDTSSGYGIRPHELDDIPHYTQAALESFPEIYPWMAWCHPEYSNEDSRSWVERTLRAWEEKEFFAFTIYDLQDHRFVGGVGLGEIDKTRKSAYLGYWVRTSCTRRGAASTAARLCAQFGIQQLALQRIEIVASVENIASQRAAEKAGAIREGILRNRLNYHDELHDAVVFSFIPADFEPQG